MRCLQTIISHGPGCRHPYVQDGSPALQFVMAVAVKQVRNGNRGACSRGFNRCERSMIVHYIVRQQNPLPPATPEIQRRKIIKCPRCSDSGEEPVVFFVPEVVHLFRLRARLLLLYGRWIGSKPCAWGCRVRRLPEAHRTEAQKPAASQKKRLEHRHPAHRRRRLAMLSSNSQWSIITMLPPETRLYKGFSQ
jgi:hypothetical protein